MLFFFYFIIIWLAFLPSLIWLWFFLRFDENPEPKNTIARVFLWGMLAGPIAFGLERVFIYLADYLSLRSGMILDLGFIGIIIAAPLFEEPLKYLAAKIGYWESPSEFDEPVDFMIYLITAGLGFAAIENVMYLLRDVSQSVGLAKGLINGGFLLFGRFLTSTLLHALTASVIGFFVAISWYYRRFRLFWLTVGLILAMGIHASYNYYYYYFIRGSSSLTGISSLIGFLSILLFLVIFIFKKISKIKSICLSHYLLKTKIKKVKVRKIYD